MVQQKIQNTSYWFLWVTRRFHKICLRCASVRNSSNEYDGKETSATNNSDWLHLHTDKIQELNNHPYYTDNVRMLMAGKNKQTGAILGGGRSGCETTLCMNQNELLQRIFITSSLQTNVEWCFEVSIVQNTAKNVLSRGFRTVLEHRPILKRMVGEKFVTAQGFKK